MNPLQEQIKRLQAELKEANHVIERLDADLTVARAIAETRRKTIYRLDRRLSVAQSNLDRKNGLVTMLASRVREAERCGDQIS